MSSVSRGNAFEDQVHQYIKDELKNENLFISPKTSLLFQKKGYYSNDRGSNIITDISIETYIPNAKDYSLLTVVECKDYSHSVSVDNIEEFYSKVQQITGANVKAIFATTASLQRAALTFAKSRKIAVLRFLPSSKVDWVVHMMTTNMLSHVEKLNHSEFISAFLNQEHRGRNRSFYGCDDRYIYGSLFSVLKEILN